MDMDGFAAELEKEQHLTLEPPTKRPCIGTSSSDKDNENPSDKDKENPSDRKELEDPADDDDDDDDDEDDDDDDDDNDDEDDDDYVIHEDTSDDGERVPPKPEMTEEQGRQYIRQVAASKGFDVPRFNCNMIGGIQPCGIDGLYRRDLKKSSKHALQVYNEKNNTSFAFAKLEKAMVQVVAGRMFFITFQARSENIRETFRAKVWKKVMNKGFEVKSIEKHSEKPVVATSL